METRFRTLHNIKVAENDIHIKRSYTKKEQVQVGHSITDDIDIQREVRQRCYYHL